MKFLSEIIEVIDWSDRALKQVGTLFLIAAGSLAFFTFIFW